MAICFVDCFLSAAYTRVLYSVTEAERTAAAFGNQAVSVADILKGLRPIVAVVSLFILDNLLKVL